MLHKSKAIIAPETLKLIQDIQKLPELKEFVLVGGTALALQLGHRNSIDIDLFTQLDFTPQFIETILKTRFTFSFTFATENTVLATVNKIKTDFIKHDYPHLNQPIQEDGITFLGKEDIAAMKLHAIIQSGQRLKGFIDIYFLLHHFSMNTMINFFSKKYSYTNPMIALKAVNFFDDIDETVDAPKLLKPLSLTQIKKRIHAATKDPDKIFQE